MNYTEAIKEIQDTVRIQAEQLLEERNRRISLTNEVTLLKHTMWDFLDGIDKNCVDIPMSMFDDFNELEKLIGKKE